MNYHSGVISLSTLTPSFRLVKNLKIFLTSDGIYNNLQLECEIAERCL